jgi:hypothetical protein
MATLNEVTIIFVIISVVYHEIIASIKALHHLK